ncbi:MAG: GntR family transcriptional regulator [Pseudomonadota bacterium]
MVYQFFRGPPLSLHTVRSSALPLHVQIHEALIRDIAAGRLSDGEKLPPERVLAGQYGTTVRTLRKALAQLEKDGFLTRVQGSGNYIQHTEETGGIYSLFRLELPQGGGLPTAHVLDVLEQDKPPDLPTFGASDRATRIQRVRHLDHLPVAVEDIWLDRSAGAVSPEALSESLYLYYRRSLGFWIRRIEDRVWLGPLPDWAPKSFPKAPGEMVGYIERLSWAQADHPVEFSRTWFDPDRARYVQRLS